MKRSILLATAALALIPLAFMNETAETVLINTDNGPVRINKADFNEDEHTLHKVSATDVKKGADPRGPQTDPNAGGPVRTDQQKRIESLTLSWGVNEASPGVFKVWDAKDEGRYIVGINGINDAGYISSKDAWDAITSVSRQNTSGSIVDAGVSGEGRDGDGQIIPADQMADAGEPVAAGYDTGNGTVAADAASTGKPASRKK